MEARLTLLPANGYRRERWRNGAGWTREIARGGSGAAGWDWRLSIAEIDAPAEFSRFPGIEREQLLLCGEGLALETGGRTVRLDPPHGRHRYPGEDAVRGVPLGGQVRAFNLMWRRASIAAELWHRPLVGSLVVFADAGSTWAVHLLAGQARLGGAADGALLEAGDSALLHAGAQRLRQPLDGHGEALLVRLVPKAAGPQ
ncbi:HutD family protein [Lysobacter sp. GX 14042]|uniref:HutD/Ves family protein n=1 Tax=Lysobacter sp. GX 14042 TaxID=2907155 RepID=UPI001F4091A7|nr:HutD family protein [Lysobacter sp. GX 14042]MCE7031842.1 HutD family protein [Lysobacter sp. GX 14042]